MAKETIKKEVETTEPKEGKDYIICPLDEIKGYYILVDFIDKITYLVVRDENGQEIGRTIVIYGAITDVDAYYSIDDPPEYIVLFERPEGHSFRTIGPAIMEDIIETIRKQEIVLRHKDLPDIINAILAGFAMKKLMKIHHYAYI
jgi:hypothetical protein